MSYLLKMNRTRASLNLITLPALLWIFFLSPLRKRKCVNERDKDRHEESLRYYIVDIFIFFFSTVWQKRKRMILQSDGTFRLSTKKRSIHLFYDQWINVIQRVLNETICLIRECRITIDFGFYKYMIHVIIFGYHCVGSFLEICC